MSDEKKQIMVGYKDSHTSMLTGKIKVTKKYLWQINKNGKILNNRIFLFYDF